MEAYSFMQMFPFQDYENSIFIESIHHIDGKNSSGNRKTTSHIELPDRYMAITSNNPTLLYIQILFNSIEIEEMLDSLQPIFGRNKSSFFNLKLQQA